MSLCRSPVGRTGRSRASLIRGHSSAIFQGFFLTGGLCSSKVLKSALAPNSWYEEYPAVYKKKVACDTISPTPDSYHVAFSADFSDRLCQLIDAQGLDAAFDHFKGYSGGEVVFTFHDAFEGELVLSSNLGEAAVQEFATGLGRTAELAAFPVDVRQNLGAVDQALNPPWWRRALRIFEHKNRSWCCLRFGMVIRDDRKDTG